MTRRRLGFLLLGMAVVLVIPWLVDDAYHRGLITNVLYLVAAASALNILSGLTGQLSVGNAGFLLIGAYSVGIMTTQWSLPPWATIPVAALLSGLVAWFIGRICIRLEAFYLGMVTLAVALALGRLVSQARDVTGGQDGLLGIPTLVEDIDLASGAALSAMGVVALTAMFMTANLNGSHWHRSMEAVRDNPLVASACGVDVGTVRVRAFVISGLLTGLTGGLFAYWQQFISPEQFGLTASLLLLLMMTLGGRGSVIGVALAAGALAMFPSMTQGLGAFHPIVYGGLLIGCAVFLPAGLAGFAHRLRPANRLAVDTKGASFDPGRVVKAPSSDRSMLRARGITKRFGGVTAVDGLDLDLRPGTIHALIGPNGAGKSSTINLLTAFERMDEGVVEVDGVPIAGLRSDQVAELGMRRTFQSSRAVEELSVLENVLLGAHQRSTPGLVRSALGSRAGVRQERELRREAMSILKWLGIAALAHELPNGVSAGHERLVEIARVLMSHPRVILLDEPAAGLSSTDISVLATHLRQLRAHGMTILLVEHHIEMVLELCDTVTVLDYGKVIASGAPSEVRRSPAVIAAYLGSDYSVDEQTLTTTVDLE